MNVELTRTSRLLAPACLLLVFSVIAAPAHAAFLMIHYDAAQGVLEAPADPAENGDSITTWEDQIGSNDAFYLNGTQPVYSTTRHNGAPAVDFTVADSRLRLASSPIVGTDPFRILARIYLDDNTARGYSVIAATHGGADPNGFEFSILNALVQFYPGAQADNPTFISGTTVLQNQTWYDVEVERSGNLFTLKLNGVVDGSGTRVTSFAGVNNLAIGAGPGYGSNNALRSLASLTLIVPEPASAMMLLLAATGGFLRRGRSTVQ